MGFISTLCLGVIAVFLPPLAVLLSTGCSGSFILNIFLTLLLWIPGVIHAWIVILRRPSRRERRREKEYQTYERHEHHSHRSHHRPSSAGTGYGYGRPAPPPSQGTYYYPQETGYTRRY